MRIDVITIFPEYLAPLELSLIGRARREGLVELLKSIGRVLPGRTNLVLTRSGQVPFEGMRAVASLDEAKAIAEGEGASELCIIGGGEIFHQLLDQASDLYLTWVDAEVPADTYFPEVDVQDWQEVSSEPHPADERHAYAFRFVHYVRR